MNVSKMNLKVVELYREPVRGTSLDTEPQYATKQRVVGYVLSANVKKGVVSVLTMSGAITTLFDLVGECEGTLLITGTWEEVDRQKRALSLQHLAANSRRY